MKLSYLKVFTDFSKDVEPLNDEEVGRLFRAMLAYAETEEAPALTGNERFVWGTASKLIDNERETYARLCERNRVNSNRRFEAEQEPAGSTPAVSAGVHSIQEKDKEKEKEKEKEKVKKKTQKKTGPYKGAETDALPLAAACEPREEKTALEKAMEAFREHRRALHAPMSGRAEELIRAKLDELAGSDDEKIEILNRSIINGYKGVFPLKKERPARERAGGYQQTLMTDEFLESLFVDLDHDLPMADEAPEAPEASPVTA